MVADLVSQVVLSGIEGILKAINQLVSFVHKCLKLAAELRHGLIQLDNLLCLITQKLNTFKQQSTGQILKAQVKEEFKSFERAIIYTQSQMELIVNKTKFKRVLKAAKYNELVKKYNSDIQKRYSKNIEGYLDGRQNCFDGNLQEVGSVYDPTKRAKAYCECLRQNKFKGLLTDISALTFDEPVPFSLAYIALIEYSNVPAGIPFLNQAEALDSSSRAALYVDICLKRLQSGFTGHINDLNQLDITKLDRAHAYVQLCNRNILECSIHALLALDLESQQRGIAYRDLCQSGLLQSNQQHLQTLRLDKDITAEVIDHVSDLPASFQDVSSAEDPLVRKRTYLSLCVSNRLNADIGEMIKLDLDTKDTAELFVALCKEGRLTASIEDIENLKLDDSSASYAYFQLCKAQKLQANVFDLFAFQWDYHNFTETYLQLAKNDLFRSESLNDDLFIALRSQPQDTRAGAYWTLRKYKAIDGTIGDILELDFDEEWREKVYRWLYEAKLETASLEKLQKLQLSSESRVIALSNMCNYGEIPASIKLINGAGIDDNGRGALYVELCSLGLLHPDLHAFSELNLNDPVIVVSFIAMCMYDLVNPTALLIKELRVGDEHTGKCYWRLCQEGVMRATVDDIMCLGLQEQFRAITYRHLAQDKCFNNRHTRVKDVLQLGLSERYTCYLYVWLYQDQSMPIAASDIDKLRLSLDSINWIHDQIAKINDSEKYQENEFDQNWGNEEYQDDQDDSYYETFVPSQVQSHAPSSSRMPEVNPYNTVNVPQPRAQPPDTTPFLSPYEQLMQQSNNSTSPAYQF